VRPWSGWRARCLLAGAVSIPPGPAVARGHWVQVPPAARPSLPGIDLLLLVASVSGGPQHLAGTRKTLQVVGHGRTTGATRRTPGLSPLSQRCTLAIANEASLLALHSTHNRLSTALHRRCQSLVVGDSERMVPAAMPMDDDAESLPAICQNCATRNLAPPHAPLLGRVFHLGGCVVTGGTARRCEPPAHRW
jgi:hypothetical protein